MMIFGIIFLVIWIYSVNTWTLVDIAKQKGYEKFNSFWQAFIPIYGNFVIFNTPPINEQISVYDIKDLYSPSRILKRTWIVLIVEALLMLVLVPLAVIFTIALKNDALSTIIITFLVVLIVLVHQGLTVEYAKKKGYESMLYGLIGLIPIYGIFHVYKLKPRRQWSKGTVRKVFSFSSIFSRFLIYGQLTFMAVIVIIPVIYIFGMAFSGLRSNVPVDIWPKEPTWAAFKFLFEETKFTTWYKNTLSIALVNMVIGTVLITGASYVFARFSFKGKKAGLLTILVLQAFPSFMGLIAMYVLFNKFNLLGIPLALSILYIGGSIPGNLWLIKGFLSQIPKDLDESAMIDGASKLRIFFSIILPLAVPILTFVAVSMFMGPWMDYMLPNYLLVHPAPGNTFEDVPSQLTLAVGIFDFINSTEPNYSAFAAAALIVGIPIAALYMIFQKYLIEGIMAGATKG